MSRPLKWLLAVIGIFLSSFSLYTIYISGKPAFDSYNIVGWVGFAIGFFILMLLLYYLNVKVGITYTLILLLLLFLMIGLEKLKHNNEKTAKEISGEMQQLDENGNIIITHPYDNLISLEWGTHNNVDLDLMLIDKTNNIFVNFGTPKYATDENNSIWLDYDYQRQKSVAMKEIISILGMKDKMFSIIVMNYNGEKLNQDAVVTIILSDRNTTTYTLPAKQFNDATNSIHVCDIAMQTNTITKVMKDFHNNITQR
ncbi:hypothetical protein [Clostridium sp. MD294]|uniref:hypothetical protein n=1 Tax=Clostridium sp. MD294 TaxID=97138 RepID=UPI0002C910CD|nr:hypothetical protein [Clostridium sp. MD294]NDO47339.1 hypothetical protein [Clostridium sp. MD294]USF29593.1 hypothetical protein C820_000993 [Clostridium sp. MD294]